MKVQTNTRIDVVQPTHQAYVTLLDDIYKEYLALKAQSTPDDAEEEAPAQTPEVKAAAQCGVSIPDAALARNGIGDALLLNQNFRFLVVSKRS